MAEEGKRQADAAQDRTPMEIKLRLSDAVSPGSYANTMMVQHTREEFVMDFALVAGGAGVVVSRLIISPGHMKRVVAALQDNVARYERAFGTVSPSSEPPTKIGFQPPAE